MLWVIPTKGYLLLKCRLLEPQVRLPTDNYPPEAVLNAGIPQRARQVQLPRARQTEVMDSACDEQAYSVLQSLGFF